MQKSGDTMNIKYLYGKKIHLEPLIKGETGPRFSDISHYSRLENEMMRDMETRKSFSFDRFTTRLEINGYVLNPKDMVNDPIYSLSVQHCYCLCLSNKKNSDELFEKFEADICIEIDVDKLLEVLNFVFSNKLTDMRIRAEEITYYDPSLPPETDDNESLVFYKPMLFQHEAEYRIALFYPNEKTGFKTVDGQTIPFSMENESLHLTLSHPETNFFKRFIIGSYEKKTSNA